MAKQGMKRPEVGPKRKNDVPPVPELQGGAKRTKEKAKPMKEKEPWYAAGVFPAARLSFPHTYLLSPLSAAAAGAFS